MCILHYCFTTSAYRDNNNKNYKLVARLGGPPWIRAILSGPLDNVMAMVPQGHSVFHFFNVLSIIQEITPVWAVCLSLADLLEKNVSSSVVYYEAIYHIIISVDILIYRL